MLIGIDASHAFLEDRMGVEEYSYQIISALSKVDFQNRYLLYLNGKGNAAVAQGLDWPDNFTLKNIPLRRFWVNFRLAFEAIKDKPDVLFIPAQSIPFFHPQNTVVTLHGLEYEYYPESYSQRRRFFLKFTTKYSLKHAAKIIAVSHNTKKDLVKVYNTNPDKIQVIYHGFDAPFDISSGIVSSSSLPSTSKPYILAIGRLEARKNIIRLILAFERIKDKRWGGQLILVGGKGFGYQKINKQIQKSPYKKDILEKGFVTREEKWAYLKKAAVFVFPSLYEGFGLPILEAFAASTPAVASKASSIPEVGGDACVYFDPHNIMDMSRKILKVLEDKDLQQKLITKGQKRLKNFSWEKCAQETLQVLLEAGRNKKTTRN